MTDESAKKAILARRARFVAAAMMSTGLVTCERNCAEPGACLSVAEAPLPDPAPTPCLTVAIPPPTPADAGASISDTGPVDAGAVDAASAPPATWPSGRVCLSPRRPPRRCLSYFPDPDDKL